MTIHSQVCFHRWLFADRVRPHWCITGPVGPLGCTNQSWCGVKLPTMSVSTHPVGCVHICHLLRGQHHSMHPNGSCIGALQGLWGHWGALIRAGVVSNCRQCPSRPIQWVVYIFVTY